MKTAKRCTTIYLAAKDERMIARVKARLEREFNLSHISTSVAVSWALKKALERMGEPTDETSVTVL